MRTWKSAVGFVGVAALALAARLAGIEQRPMHTDEAVNAFLTGDLLEGRGYTYDPVDRHGPALYAVSAPVARAAGFRTHAALDEFVLRLPPALFSAAMVMAFGLIGGAPLRARLLAAAGWAIAPLPLYYGRDFIHESAFTLVAMVTLVLAHRAWIRSSWKTALGAGICAGVALAFKETALLGFAAAALAWIVVRPARPATGPRGWVLAVTALGGAAIAVGLMFTNGGRDVSNLASLLRAAGYAWNRAGGQGHEKPAFYYLALFTRGYAGPGLLLLAAAAVPLLRRANTQIRLIAVYGLALAAIYSLIPYKTPWLGLAFLWPILLAVGMALDRGLASASLHGRAAMLAFTLAQAVGFASDSWRWVYRAPAAPDNPIAYAQTSPDLLRLPRRLSALSRGRETRAVIAVSSADPWPLPWYLRRWPRVGFWGADATLPRADFYVLDADRDAESAGVPSGFVPDFFEVRPGTMVALWSPRPPAAADAGARCE
jgi:uncharacterized protein (TIGR03663 family)